MGSSAGRNAGVDSGDPQTFASTQDPDTAYTCGESCGERNDHSAKHEHIARSHLKKVKARRLAVFAMAGITATVVLILAASAYWEHKQRLFANAPDLFAAVRAFCRDQPGRGQVPPVVSLQDLLKGGYVSSNEVRTFQPFEVTFSTHYSDDAPQMILARALAPDGQSICLLADGSVQQFSPARYQEYLRSSDHPIRATNRLETPRPGTNGPSTTNGLSRAP